MIRLTMVDEASAKIKGLQGRLERRQQMMAAAGALMRDEIVPQIFMSGGGQKPWERTKLRSGPVMRDSGRLMQSIAYYADGSHVAIYTQVPYAGVHNRPYGTRYEHVPSMKKYIAIPNPETLTSAEFRGAIPWDFRDAFFMKGRDDAGPARIGPRGRGIYRRRGNGVELLFWLKDKVFIPARPFLYWTTDALRRIGNSLRMYLLSGTFASGATSYPLSDGVPDVGNRGGRP